jgi:hypothetical protein
VGDQLHRLPTHAFDQCCQQRLFGGKIVVEGAFGNADGAENLLNGGLLIAFLGENLLRYIEALVAPDIIFFD